MRRRILGTVAATVLAVAGTLLLVAYVRGAEDRALAGEELVPVLVVADPVARGSAEVDLVGSVRLERVPAKVRAAGAINDLDEVQDLVTAIDLVPGEQLIGARFTTAESLLATRTVEAPPGTIEVTVSLEPERALGGEIVPGDTVAVIASFDPFTVAAEPAPDDGGIVVENPDGVYVGSTEGDGPGAMRTPNATSLLLRHITVTNVQVEQLPRTYDETPAEGAPDLAPTGNLLVTLAVTPDGAQRLVFTAEHGFLWLASDEPTAPSSPDTVVTRETIYR